MYRCFLRPALLMAGLVYVPIHAAAQHPVDVQKLSAAGEHFRALSMYELLPDRAVGTDTRIAAAKSAWALGLTRVAAQEFDIALRDADLSGESRARLTLSRGVLEYQDERYPEAALYAEKATSHLPSASPLRGRAFMLWGQSLVRTGAFGSAQQKLEHALKECDQDDRAEIRYALGMVLLRIGRLQEAQEQLEGVPSTHERSPAAVRALAAIALQSGEYDRLKFWIEKGRSQYPEAFIDSWADYGLLQVALAADDLSQARAVVARAHRDHPASDSWLTVMEAALEQAEWVRRERLAGSGGRGAQGGAPEVVAAQKGVSQEEAESVRSRDKKARR